MPKVSLVLETLDNVEEALKPFYSEREDGKFHLETDNTIRDHADVGNLVRAHQRTKDDLANARNENQELKAKLVTVPDDFDIKVWQAAKDGKADEAALVAERQRLEGERDVAIAERDEARKELKSASVERDLNDALSANGIKSSAFQQAARALLLPKVGLDEKGKPIVESDMGPLALSSFVQRWAAGDGKEFVSEPKGGGAKGSGSDTKSKKWGDMSSAEKVALHRSNPEEYQRVKEAG